MIAFLLPLLSLQQPSHGIDRELAWARAARVSDVRYELAFDLVAGRATLRFRLGADGASTPLVLDFGGGELTELTVNDRVAATARVHDHVVLAVEALRPGENAIRAASPPSRTRCAAR